MPDPITVAFRVDASTLIGSGHVMRCLTLADTLVKLGNRCHFLMRNLPGNLAQMVVARGHDASLLDAPGDDEAVSTDAATADSYKHWLGTDWESDAEETVQILSRRKIDWLIVDHYALNWRWEERVSPSVSKLMVIDDLADRQHVCDVLLDQNLSRSEADYRGLVPRDCKMLVGTRYALLRDEFRLARTASLSNRKGVELHTILVSMGGVDRENITSRVLAALEGMAELSDVLVVVVLGAACPHTQSIVSQADQSPLNIDVRISANNMAELMVNADLAIGAAGGSAWERCCLGLPSVLVLMAENQMEGAEALHKSGAAISIGSPDRVSEALPLAVRQMLKQGCLERMSSYASEVCDGVGVDRVAKVLSGASL